MIKDFKDTAVTDAFDNLRLMFEMLDSLLKPLPMMATTRSEQHVVGKVKKGKASFYSLKFEGRKTATGSTFSHKNYTAASNTFPLGTYVLVTNPKNKQFVVVRINDRMSKFMSKKGRIVDLTRLAAKDLGILKLGIGSVLVQKVQKEPNK